MRTDEQKRKKKKKNQQSVLEKKMLRFVRKSLKTAVDTALEDIFKDWK